METAAVLRSFHGVPRITQHAHFSLDKLVMAPISNATFRSSSFSQVSVASRSLISSTVNRRGPLQPCVKAAETTSASTSDVSILHAFEDILKDLCTHLSTVTEIFLGCTAKHLNWKKKLNNKEFVSDKTAGVPSEKKNIRKSTFPSGFETLVLEVCDETDVAELKLKVGDFEMHLKRDVRSPIDPTPSIVSPTTAPPVPTKPMIESGPAAQPVASQKSPPPVTSPFANVSSAKASKLAALEASGSNAYVLVSSPTVGSFRRGRTMKGKKQPPSCKEGDIIKEGQTIGYLDQFGNELPIRSNVAGEVLKILFKDGEAVGYGDPLVAVLPSFHGIK